MTESAIRAAAQEVVRAEAEAVAAVADQIDETLVAVSDLLLTCTGKVFTVGSGTSGTIARRLAHLLSVCGTPAAFLHPMDALHGTMGVLDGSDVIIAISKGGESAEINDLLELARRRAVPVVAVTAAPDSTMARRSDIVVTLRTSRGADPGGVIAMGSTLVTAVWGDALAVVMMRRRGYSWERMLETHPAGAVGRRSDMPAELAPLED